jgi:hypothetical protein
MVALFTSNCKLAGATERFKYLQELLNHIPVSIYIYIYVYIYVYIYAIHLILNNLK